MKINYHKDTDSLYMHLKETPTLESEEVAPGTVLHFDEDGSVTGFEIYYGASEKVDLSDLEISGLGEQTLEAHGQVGLWRLVRTRTRASDKPKRPAEAAGRYGVTGARHAAGRGLVQEVRALPALLSRSGSSVSMHPTDEDNRPQEEDERTQRTEPLYHSWLGHPVVISYSRASNWWDFEHPYEISRGAVEGREALFLLEQSGSVGVGVRRILEAEEDREELGELLFVPWGAIHSMYSLATEEPEEQPSDE